MKRSRKKSSRGFPKIAWPMIPLVVLTTIAAVFALSSYTPNQEMSISPPDGIVSERLSIKPGFYERHFVLSRPAKLEEGKQYPLIIGFHGFRGDVKAWFHQYTRFEELAAQKQFIVAFPEAPISWKNNAQDERFFREMLGDIMKTMPVDKDRIYVVGHSNGAIFASHLAMTYPGYIAAGAVQAGLVNPKAYPENRNRRVPLFIAWGGQDGGNSDWLANDIQLFRDRGHTVKTFLPENMGHGWAHPSYQLEEQMVEFLLQHSQPDQFPELP